LRPVRIANRWILAGAMVIMLAGCASGIAGTPTTSARTTNLTSLPTLSQLPSANVFGTCRLPVGVPYQAGEAPGGWLDLPGGNFARDPSSRGVDSSNIIAWDGSIGRWIPTDPLSISPDGNTYLSMLTGDIQVVDARSGTVMHQTKTDGVFPNHVIAYTDSGIYLRAQGIAPPPGLWKVDPSSGALTQISSASGLWEVVNGSWAWGTDALGTVRRLELSSGTANDVYKSAHRSVDVAGTVGSGVLVFESGDANQPATAAVIEPDGSSTQVEVPPAMQRSFNGYFQDGPVVLITGYGFGLAGYDANHGLQVLPGTSVVYQVFGRCAPA